MFSLCYNWILFVNLPNPLNLKHYYLHCGELNRIMYEALPPFMLADIPSHHLRFLPSQNVVYFLLKHNLAIALFALIPLRNTSLLA